MAWDWSPPGSLSAGNTRFFVIHRTKYSFQYNQTIIRYTHGIRFKNQLVSADVKCFIQVLISYLCN